MLQTDMFGNVQRLGTWKDWTRDLLEAGITDNTQLVANVYADLAEARGLFDDLGRATNDEQRRTAFIRFMTDYAPPADSILRRAREIREGKG